MRAKKQEQNASEETSDNMEIENQIKTLKWSEFRTVHEAGQLYIVIDQLELSEVATKAVENDHSYINNCLQNGLIAPPTKEEIRYFNTNENMNFNSIKVEPYLFVQRIRN